MPLIKYENKKFSEATAGIITQANEIIDQYRQMGFSLTLRQLYYQFVARALIINTEQSYKRLGNIISDARRAGLIDWTAIEDRTRFLRSLPSWDKPQDILESARVSYHRDLWANQNKRLEVWIEKDALVGVIDNICRENDVPYFSCRGYVSDSEMWVAAFQRILKYDKNGQDTLILHLGDHDPSGMDMTRDIDDRLHMFSGFRTNLEIRRIALTMEQIEALNPPPNPAKVTDSRYTNYVSRFGEESWELDALEPQYIANLIQGEIELERDEASWNELYAEQEAERDQLADVISQWDNLFNNDKQ